MESCTFDTDITQRYTAFSFIVLVAQLKPVKEMEMVSPEVSLRTFYYVHAIVKFSFPIWYTCRPHFALKVTRLFFPKLVYIYEGIYEPKCLRPTNSIPLILTSLSLRITQEAFFVAYGKLYTFSNPIKLAFRLNSLD